MRNILYALILTPVFFSCTKQKLSNSDTLIIGIESEVKNLDLKNSFDLNSSQVISLFSQSLMRINSDMVPETELAISHKVEDARIFSFELPPEATFHNGTPLTCEDVLASFTQASSEGSRIKSAFDDVKEYSCPTKSNFKIVLNNPKASFLAGDVTAVRIMPKAMAETKDPIPPMGSGPYKFVKRENRDIIFERFENFTRYRNGKRIEEKQFFKKVIVRSVQDPTTRWLSLSSGDIDVLVNALSPQKVLEAKKMENLTVHEKPGNSFQYLGFNLRLPKFEKLKVRQAVAHAIDRKAIIQHKLYGLASPAPSVLSPLNFYHNKNLPNYEYNPEKAKALLKEAGFSDLNIEFKISSDRDVSSIMMVIKEQLEKVGIKVTLRPYEFATFFSDVQKGNFEMFSLRWVAVTEPDIMHKIFHSEQTPPGRNRVYFSNKRLDKLVTMGAVESNLEKRRELYNEAQEIVAKELPYVPLWYPSNIAVTSNRIKDYDLSAIGTWASLLEARKE